MDEHDRDFNILLVEDDPGDAALIRRLLRNTGFSRFGVSWVTSLATARQELVRGNYDLVLLDLSLPDTAGLATVKAGCAAAAHLPVVVLTGHDDREFALEALALGASDYLVKGSIDEDSLNRSLRYALARARTEAALKESAASLSATLNATADGILAVDAQGRVLFYNLLFARLWQLPTVILEGGEEQALLGHVLDQLSDPAAFLHEVERLQASAENSFDTLHFKDGRVFERYSFPLQRGAALTPGRVWSFRDITERRRAEDALLQSEKKLKAAFEGSHDAIIIMNIKGELLDCNRRALDLYGLGEREEIKGKWPAFFLPAQQPDGRDSATAMEEYYSEAGKRDGFLRFEWLYRRLDGSTFPAEVTLTSYTLGETVVLQTNVNDITVRKEYEVKLQYLSLHDALTDIYNRAFFDAELQRLDGSREYPVTIMVADLDGLKLVNDALGHAAGDVLIKACASVLKKSLRAYDILARIGGDEFAAILPRASAAVAEKVLSRMRVLGEAHNREHQELPLHFSLGAATAETAAVSLQDVYKKADSLMYRDKQARKENVRS